MTGGLEPIRIALTRLVMLAEWTSPLLAIAYGPSLLWRIWGRRLRFYDLIFPLNVIAYLCFPVLGGNQYGPRYYFDSFPLLAVTIASALAALIANRRRPRIGGFAVGISLGHGMICCAGFVVLAFLMRQVVNDRMDLFDQVHRDGLKNAVVIVRSGTGTVRPMDPMDLTRNGLARDGSVIYALDAPERMAELRAMFPGRMFLVYERKPHQTRGRLIPLDDSTVR